MRLLGTIAPDRPLLVVAVREEAAYLDDRLPVLLTGIGKINAAAALATVLAQGEKPDEVINLGTAGALRPGWEGTHHVTQVIQHDLDSPALLALTGRSYGAPLIVGRGDGPVLATGDLFVSDPAARDRLAEHADLVDMEGYAVATVAHRAGLPVRLIKHVSDEAGDGAAHSWRESVDDCARHLAHWVAAQGW
ncbi:nucleoside phosphorylase [Streptomyces kaniharaensis]|uniref:Nucleoside phosphorylase n=1 Tax=Streptomyces kaniharaensis TaxID=212423 RepID=A0A6N7KVL2_9ACTN|nr:nucleosidase [Streptomyces kaniharaensis]MQS14358.1 nucleoside phosphorylase [Streptomyces kaniharaensis]